MGPQSSLPNRGEVALDLCVRDGGSRGLQAFFQIIRYLCFPPNRPQQRVAPQ